MRGGRVGEEIRVTWMVLLPVTFRVILADLGALPMRRPLPSAFYCGCNCVLIVTLTATTSHLCHLEPLPPSSVM